MASNSRWSELKALLSAHEVAQAQQKTVKIAADTTEMAGMMRSFVEALLQAHQLEHALWQKVPLTSHQFDQFFRWLLDSINSMLL